MHKFRIIKDLTFVYSEYKVVFEEKIDCSIIEQICPYEQNIQIVKKSVEEMAYVFD